MWDLPHSLGIVASFSVLAGEFLSTVPPEKSRLVVFFLTVLTFEFKPSPPCPFLFLSVSLSHTLTLHLYKDTYLITPWENAREQPDWGFGQRFALTDYFSKYLFVISA